MKLGQKLLEIQKACKYFQKDTKGYNFTYTSGSTILAVVRQKMDELGVLCYPEIREAKTTLVDPVKEGKPKNILTELTMDFVWRCTETDAQMRIPWYGQGLKDTEQGIGNALTYAERYFLLKFFKIPSDSDDPDFWNQKHPEKAKTKEELEAEKKAEEKKQFKKIKDAIWKYIESHEGFIGFLIDQGLDPNEDDNIMAIYNQASSLKKQYRGNS